MKVCIGVIYRPPNNSAQLIINSFEEVISNMILRYDGVVCVGDFNINMLDSDDMAVNFNYMLEVYDDSGYQLN